MWCIKEQRSKGKTKCSPYTHFIPEKACCPGESPCAIIACSDSAQSRQLCQITQEPWKEMTISKVIFNYIIYIFEFSDHPEKSSETTISSHCHFLQLTLTEGKNTRSKAVHVVHALGTDSTGECHDVLMKVSWSVYESLF